MNAQSHMKWKVLVADQRWLGVEKSILRSRKGSSRTEAPSGGAAGTKGGRRNVQPGALAISKSRSIVGAKQQYPPCKRDVSFLARRWGGDSIKETEATRTPWKTGFRRPRSKPQLQARALGGRFW